MLAAGHCLFDALGARFRNSRLVKMMMMKRKRLPMKIMAGLSLGAASAAVGRVRRSVLFGGLFGVAALALLSGSIAFAARSVSFGAPTGFAIEDYAQFVATGDLDGDGNLNLATVTHSATVAVLLGTGTGSFGA